MLLSNKAIAKTVYIVILAIIVTAAVTGASVYYLLLPSPSSTSEPTPIHVIGLSNTLTDQVIKDLKTLESKTNTKIIVDFVSSLDNTLNKARLELSTGFATFDIFVGIDVNFIQEFSAKGWMEPLDGYLNASVLAEHGLDEVSQTVWSMGRGADGKQYGIPMHISCMGFSYRKDMFEAKGLPYPTTIDELIAAAKALNDPTNGTYGIGLDLLSGSAGGSTIEWAIWSYGGSEFDSNYMPIFNNTAGVKAAQAIQELVKYGPPGVLSFSPGDTSAIMTSGKLGMALQWFTRTGINDNATLSKVVGLVDYKLPPGETGYGVARRSADCLAVMNCSKNKQAAVNVILNAMEPQFDLIRAPMMGVPIRPSVANNLTNVQKYRWWPNAMNIAANYSQVSPLFPEYISKCRMIICQGYQQAWVGAKPVQRALDDAAQECYTVLKDAGYYD